MGDSGFFLREFVPLPIVPVTNTIVLIEGVKGVGWGVSWDWNSLRVEAVAFSSEWFLFQFQSSVNSGDCVYLNS